MKTSRFLLATAIVASGCGSVDIEHKPPATSPDLCPDTPLALSFGEASGRLRRQGISVVVDQACNTIVAGTSEAPVDFGGGVIGSSDGWFGFVLKLDPSGKLLWSKALPAHAFFEGKDALGVAPDGSILLAGSLSADVDLGGGLLGGKYDMARYAFLLKLDAAGNHVFSKRLEGNVPADVGYMGGFYRIVQGLAIDADGSFVIGGKFLGTMDLGGLVVQSKPLVIAGQPDNYKPSVFLAKYDAQGSLLWGKQPGGDLFNAGVGLDITGAGEIVFAFSQEGDSMDPSVVKGGYFIKLGPAGDEIWRYVSPESWFFGGSSVAATEDGGMVIGGEGLLVIAPVGTFSPAFLARFSANGSPTLGANVVGGSNLVGGSSTLVSAVLPDENAGIRGVGSFDGSLLVQGKLLAQAAGGLDPFEVHVEWDNEAHQASSLGGAGDALALALARTPDGDHVVVGIEEPLFYNNEEKTSGVAGGARLFVRRSSP